MYNASGFEKRDANSFVLLEGGKGSKYKLRHLPPPVAAVANHFNEVYYSWTYSLDHRDHLEYFFGLFLALLD